MTYSGASFEPPNVRPRPEIIDVMRKLGNQEMSAGDAHEKLRAIVLEYLPSEASLRHGHLVGMMLSFELFSSTPIPGVSVGAARRGPDWPESTREWLHKSWHEAYEDSPSPLAADIGVRTLNAEVFLNCFEPCIGKAFHLLNEGLRVLFPEEVVIR